MKYGYQRNVMRIISVLAVLFFTSMAAAQLDEAINLPDQVNVATRMNHPQLDRRIPSAPNIAAKSYILVDAKTGHIIAQKNAHLPLAPASLTKLMSVYIIQTALKSGQISLEDQVHISTKAWRTGGSRMFVKAGARVPVSKLIQGIIVASGNDATTAMAEHIAGSESKFVQTMNDMAETLQMNNTHFVDATGLPAKGHISTAYDLAILARAVVEHYPEYYPWFRQKWIVYNKIKQANRNKLLWRDNSVDGMKTGHTNAAGYCLITSAVRQNTRLISVVMGTKNEEARASQSARLLNYGFRYYETRKIFSANQPIKKVRVWLGKNNTVALGLAKDLYATIPKGQYKNIRANVVVNKKIEAPIKNGQVYGKVQIRLNNKILVTRPLVALQADPRGSTISRAIDHVNLFFHSLMHINAS